MSQVFMNEVERLKRQILSLSAMVEEHVMLTVNALRERDEAKAKQVVNNDNQIDAAEVEVEEEGLKILALHQPVAIDLRFVTAVLKINNDLERIGDIASNVARRTRRLCQNPEVDVPSELIELGRHVRDMLHDSLDAFVILDPEKALAICARDDRADELTRRVRTLAQEAAVNDSERLPLYVDIILAARNFERIGDLATNICEDVIYMVRGEIVRHKDLAECD